MAWIKDFSHSSGLVVSANQNLQSFSAAQKKTIAIQVISVPPSCYPQGSGMACQLSLPFAWQPPFASA
jgi:hypothetical protein